MYATSVLNISGLVISTRTGLSLRIGCYEFWMHLPSLVFNLQKNRMASAFFPERRKWKWLFIRVKQKIMMFIPCNAIGMLFMPCLKSSTVLKIRLSGSSSEQRCQYFLDSFSIAGELSWWFPNANLHKMSMSYKQFHKIWFIFFCFFKKFLFLSVHIEFCCWQDTFESEAGTLLEAYSKSTLSNFCKVLFALFVIY